MSKRELRQKLYRTMHTSSNDLIEYGVIQERERIIALLTDRIITACTCRECEHTKRLVEAVKVNSEE